jgi:hypothetical protein
MQPVKYNVMFLSLHDLAKAFCYCTVAYRPVVRQKPRKKQQDNSRCYAMIVRWAVILDPFLCNGSVNTFPLPTTRETGCCLRGPHRGVLKKRTGATSS